MQSKNVLWLGLLFVSLLTVFCVAKYIDKFNPNIKTITTPSAEIVDKNLELKPIVIKDDLKKQNSTDTNDINNSGSEVDKDYLQIIKLVEQEEKDIEEAYNRALKLEKQKKPKLNKEKKPVKTTKTVKNKKRKIKKDRKFLIETIIASQLIDQYGSLSMKQKRKLKKIAQTFKRNSSYFIRVEANKRDKKLYKIKRYLISLGVPSRSIQILYKNKREIISISNRETIEISVIKTTK
jgi:hypothetical protein